MHHMHSREKFSNARVSLNLERTEPEKSFRCGPFAVGKIWLAQNSGRGLPDAIFNSRCTARGTSLPQVQELAETVGLPLRAAKRAPGAPLIVPAVVHWKVGHYAAVVAKRGDSEGEKGVRRHLATGRVWVPWVQRDFGICAGRAETQRDRSRVNPTF